MNKTFNDQSPRNVLVNTEQVDNAGGHTPNPGFDNPDGHSHAISMAGNEGQANRTQYLLPNITPNASQNKYVSFTNRGPPTINHSKGHDFTQSSFTLGGTLYKFKRKSIHERRASPSPQMHLANHVHPANSINQYYDKHVSTCIDKYREQEVHRRKLSELQGEQDYIRFMGGSRGSLSLSKMGTINLAHNYSKAPEKHSGFL